MKKILIMLGMFIAILSSTTIFAVGNIGQNNTMNETLINKTNCLWVSGEKCKNNDKYKATVIDYNQYGIVFNTIPYGSRKKATAFYPVFDEVCDFQKPAVLLSRNNIKSEACNLTPNATYKIVTMNLAGYLVAKLVSVGANVLQPVMLYR